MKWGIINDIIATTVCGVGRGAGPRRISGSPPVHRLRVPETEPRDAPHGVYMSKSVVC